MSVNISAWKSVYFRMKTMRNLKMKAIWDTDVNKIILMQSVQNIKLDQR